ncbi:MAG TPA: nucleotidyltransferase family protein [Candidatus Nanoarchaeia archaeon]|nr:nucleotidyltransferase family protein [Candidatus Nanoarchaeia archaeon]
MEMIDTAIILAGGLGTRLRPLTYNIPKPLLPIKGQPIVEHAIKNMAQQGIKKIILSIGYKSETIQEYFGDGKKWGVHISYSLESNPLGTGGAIKKALGNLNQPVFVVWGDNLMDINYRELNSIHQKYKKLVTMVLTEREDVENFGVAKLEGERIISFVEKPKREDAPSNLINAGAIVLEPQGVKKIPQEQFSIEYDYYEKLKPGEIIAFIHKGQWFPTDTLEKYKHAEDNFKPKL